MRNLYLSIFTAGVFACVCAVVDCQANDRGTSTISKGIIVGLVLEFSGQWELESKFGKRRLTKRGMPVYEGERPIRKSTGGALTVSCINSTRAQCPGNHKIGEPFVLSASNSVDDWWTQLVPFLTNYGSWIFPVSRGMSDVSLNDAVVRAPSKSNNLDLGDALSNLADGAYEVEIVAFGQTPGATKRAHTLQFLKKDRTAISVKEEEVGNFKDGIYTVKILSGPPSSKEIDWSSVDPALIAIIGPDKFDQCRKALQATISKTATWDGTGARVQKREIIRALLAAFINAPVSKIPGAY